MIFLGFISGKRIRFPGKWAKTFKNPGSLTSTQTERERERGRECACGCSAAEIKAELWPAPYR